MEDFLAERVEGSATWHTAITIKMSSPMIVQMLIEMSAVALMSLAVLFLRSDLLMCHHVKLQTPFEFVLRSLFDLWHSRICGKCLTELECRFVSCVLNQRHLPPKPRCSFSLQTHVSHNMPWHCWTIDLFTTMHTKWRWVTLNELVEWQTIPAVVYLRKSIIIT